MNEEEKEAIEYFEDKIKNKLPLYEETYVDGKPYRRNILQLETNFTEEQANKTQIVLNLIDKLQKENEELKKQVDIEFVEENYIEKSKVISKDKIRNKIKELEEELEYETTKNEARLQISLLEELLKEN